MNVPGRGLACLLVLAISTACLGCPSGAKSLASGGGRTVIHMAPWFYMPSDNMKVSEENPFPREAIRVLAREWEQAHPGVIIEFVSVPGGQTGYQSWVFTHCTGGMSPEIMFWWPPGDDLAMRGWVVPLDDYLARPNPYVAGNKRWRDLILPLTIEPPWQAQDGHIYHLPFDLFLTALFYNKGILAEAGIERMPETWAEFTEALRRIQKAGYEPFWCSALWSVWPRALFGEYLYDDEVFRKLDVLTPDDRIDPEEGVRGAYLGIAGIHEPRFREYMRLMKEWAKYWKWGFSFNRTTDSIDLFRTNRLAFRWDSALNLTEYLIDPYMKFEFGITWFPAMTIETSPLASARTPVVRAVPGNSYYISRTAADRGLADLCVDWLMFLTTPEHSTRLTQEATGVKVPSAIVGAGIDPSLEPLMDFDLGFKHHLAIPWAATPESVDNCDRIFELYLMDQVTMEEAISRMAKWMEAGVEEVIRINQRLPNPADRWDLSRW